jgi:hypothetical protein
MDRSWSRASGAFLPAAAAISFFFFFAKSVTYLLVSLVRYVSRLGLRNYVMMGSSRMCT